MGHEGAALQPLELYLRYGISSLTVSLKGRINAFGSRHEEGVSHIALGLVSATTL